VMIRELDRVTYGNFKDSVKDRELHDAYQRVWGAMASTQDPPPYSAFRWKAKQPRSFDDLFSQAPVDHDEPLDQPIKPTSAGVIHEGKTVWAVKAKPSRKLAKAIEEHKKRDRRGK